jgi:hypothetical protein
MTPRYSDDQVQGLATTSSQMSIGVLMMLPILLSQTQTQDSAVDYCGNELVCVHLAPERVEFGTPQRQ